MALWLVRTRTLPVFFEGRKGTHAFGAFFRAGRVAAADFCCQLKHHRPSPFGPPALALVFRSWVGRGSAGGIGNCLRAPQRSKGGQREL